MIAVNRIEVQRLERSQPASLFASTSKDCSALALAINARNMCKGTEAVCSSSISQLFKPCLSSSAAFMAVIERWLGIWESKLLSRQASLPLPFGTEMLSKNCSGWKTWQLDRYNAIPSFGESKSSFVQEACHQAHSERIRHDFCNAEKSPFIIRLFQTRLFQSNFSQCKI